MGAQQHLQIDNQYKPIIKVRPCPFIRVIISQRLSAWSIGSPPLKLCPVERVILSGEGQPVLLVHNPLPLKVSVGL